MKSFFGQIQTLIVVIPSVFIASDLEMDGDRLVVGENFQTSDPNIYAAGPFVKINQEVNYQYRYTSEMEVAGKVIYLFYIIFFYFHNIYMKRVP